MKPARRAIACIACALGLIGLCVLNGAAAAASPTAPAVTISVPPSPLDGPNVQVSANAFASQGRTIASVAFQIAPAESGAWQTFATVGGTGPYNATLDTTNTTYVPGNGSYDLRAVATDSAGETGSSAVVQDATVANNATYIGLGATGSPLHGTLTVTATPDPGAGIQPVSVTFQARAFGSQQWRDVATATAQVDQFGNPTGLYVANFDTTRLTDGVYDLRVTGEDAPAQDPFVGAMLSGVLVDNTVPTVSMANPGAALTGVVRMNASAGDAGSGVAAVRFESAPAGSGKWTTLGVDTSPPYALNVDTSRLVDGTYDLRAEATDVAGNTAASAPVSSVEISNPGAQQFTGLTITNYFAPANRISLLGEIPGSPQHEAWAYGFTNAPPPTVDGAPLPYTTPGVNQFVLLRYTDDTGWQIVDVLRNSDGSAYQLSSSLTVTGQMTGSGEAWIVASQHVGGVLHVAAFHRAPGGAFKLDPTASSTLQSLLGPSGAAQAQVRLGQTPAGDVYGLLLAPQQPSQSPSVPTANGSVATISTQLRYGQLTNGAWSVQQGSLPPDYVAPAPNVTVSLAAADPSAPGTGWGLLYQGDNYPAPLILASFDQNGWHFVKTGLDALDLTNQFRADSQASTASGDHPRVATPLDVRADPGGVWIQARVWTGRGQVGSVVARYDAALGSVVDSWCTGLPRLSFGCAQPFDLDHPATLPTRIFDTGQGLVAEGLSIQSGAVAVYAHGVWKSVPAPGYQGGAGAGSAVFADPQDGWLVGPNSLGRVSPTPVPSRLAPWPEANRAPLLSAALPPGQSTTDTAGALTVGLNGSALHYDPAAGWLVDATPPRAHHIALTGVAFNTPSSAFAVGQDGLILRWDGSSWSEDPQSVSVTTATLNAIAFATNGEGWAVGARGTIIHYDGTSWSPEQIDTQDAGRGVTSVAVAGTDVFAIAGGNLIERASDGTWQRANPSQLPSPAPPTGSLVLVSGLPDGGLVVAGKSLMMSRQSASAHLQYVPQTFTGIPVGLAAFRDQLGDVRAYLSVAPPIVSQLGPTDQVGGFPAGDGDLLLQTPGGWDDLSHTQSPTSTYSAAGDGAVQPDPVLAMAVSPDGTHAWAVGGYSGTHAADGVGTDTPLAARSSGWLTSAIWRFDAAGSVSAASVDQAQSNLPASPGTVSFAFFSSALCKVQCASVQDAQPFVNLDAAAREIAGFAQQPGGPAFAMLGGNAVGPMDSGSFGAGSGSTDLARLAGALAPLGSLPTYAAYGPRDAVPTSPDPALPWADAFSRAPAPFGTGPQPAGITGQGSGDGSGQVSKYYSFDATQNGGTLRVIVLDNSAGSLEASAPGQTTWLTGQLSAAQALGLPVVAIAAEPLVSGQDGAATDADQVAAQLAAAGVLGVFTTSGGEGASWSTQSNQVQSVPANAAPGAPQIPDYEGATLTYQQPQNNGVLWYEVSVDTVAQKLSVNAIPVISSLALEPLNGLTVARSSTLSFQAVGRRPVGTIATTPADPSFPGFNQYVSIPAGGCTGCVNPSYSFTSSNPVVGDFVVPSGSGSPFPKLDAQGKPTRSSTSGLFCAFNSGTTTVTVTAGLLTASLPVTVKVGGFGPPCGTVPGGTNTNVVVLPGRVISQTSQSQGGGAPVAPGQGPGVNSALPKILLPPPPPAVVVVPHPAVPASKPVKVPLTSVPPVPGATPVPIQPTQVAVPPIVLPLIPPAVTPVPPGGATVSAQATARREEKARKHAQQSAYVIRPAGSSGADWFFPAVGLVTVLALLLSAGAMRPRPKLAVVELRDAVDPLRRRC